MLKRRHPNAERLQRLTQHAQKDFYKRSGEDVGEDEAVHYCDQRCDDGVRFFIYTSAVLAASDAAEPQATNGSSDVPRITLMRGASIEDFQMVKNPGYYCTSSAHYVGTFWDYSNVEDPDFDLCDLKLVFCSNPAEKGCCFSV